MERRSGPLLCGQPLLGGQCFLLAGHDGPHNPGARAADSYAPAAKVGCGTSDGQESGEYSIAPAHHERLWRTHYQGSWPDEGAENRFHRAGVEKLHRRFEAPVLPVPDVPRCMYCGKSQTEARQTRRSGAAFCLSSCRWASYTP